MKLFITLVVVAIMALSPRMLLAQNSCDGMLQAGLADARKATASNNPEARLNYAVAVGLASDIAPAAKDLKRWYEAQHKADRYGELINHLMFNAVASGNKDSIRALVAAGASATGTPGHENAPMMAGAECGQITSMQTLLDLGANVSQSDKSVIQTNVPATPLETAVAERQSEATTWLLVHGADACSPTAHGRLVRLLNSSAIRSRVAKNDLRKLMCTK